MKLIADYKHLKLLEIESLSPEDTHPEKLAPYLGIIGRLRVMESEVEYPGWYFLEFDEFMKLFKIIDSEESKEYCMARGDGGYLRIPKGHAILGDRNVEFTRESRTGKYRLYFGEPNEIEQALIYAE